MSRLRLPMLLLFASWGFASGPAHAKEVSGGGAGAEPTRTAAAPSSGPPATPSRDTDADDVTPPSPLEVDYAQYGVGIGTELPVSAGAICPSDADTPCILGLGGGPILRGGYRPAGPWYFGGAYQFSKVDSNNLFRLGILQQARFEVRYFFPTGARIEPYVTWALGGMVYGNEFSVSTGGATTFAGGGLEVELTRFAVVGLNVVYQPMLFAEFVDSAGQARDTGVAQYVHLELVIELRSELGRE